MSEQLREPNKTSWYQEDYDCVYEWRDLSWRRKLYYFFVIWVFYCFSLPFLFLSFVVAHFEWEQNYNNSYEYWEEVRDYAKRHFESVA